MIEALLGVVVGALLSGIVQYFLTVRSEKKRSENIARSFQAEISAVIKIVEHRKYLQGLQEAYDAKIPISIAINQNYFTVYEDNCKEIGLLPDNISIPAIEFYTFSKSVLEDVQTFCSSANHDFLECYPELIETLKKALESGKKAIEEVNKCYGGTKKVPTQLQPQSTVP